MNDYNIQGNAPTPAPNTGKGFSIAALILGILSCILAWIYLVNIAAIVLSVLGLVFAVMGRKKAAVAGAPNGLGTAGLVLSIIGLSISAIGFISCTLCVACAAKAGNDAYNAYLQRLTI